MNSKYEISHYTGQETTAGWGSDQNKGRFIAAALMKIIPSFLPQHLDSLLSRDEGVAAVAGTGCFFLRAVE